MPGRIDNAFLSEQCSKELTGAEGTRACRIAKKLGPLASRWMSRQALRLVGRLDVPERLPATVPPGVFHVLLAIREDFPVLRAAFVMPLRWVRDADHSRRLPPTLLADADTALALHYKKPGYGRRGRWGLSPNFPDHPEFDLSGLEIDGPSALAAMLAALQLAEAGIGADGTVLATAACDGGAWSRVGRVAAKLDAAVASGAKRVYLSDGNSHEGDAWEQGHGKPGVVRYIEAAPTIWDSLSPFLEELEAPPLPGSSIDAYADYYERAMASRSRGDARRDYYMTTLVELLESRCRNHPAIVAVRSPVRCLVGCVAPGQAPSVSLLARLLKPKSVLLMHAFLEEEPDDQLLRDIDALEGWLRSQANVPAVERRPLRLLEPNLENLTKEVHTMLATAAADGATGLVIDVTNGPKRLALALLESAPPGAVCLLVDSRQAKGGHRIGSECIVAVGSVKS